MKPDDISFDNLFDDLNGEEYNEFGLRRQIRFISERIIAEYTPSDCLSTREIIHPMDAYRTPEPFFVHRLVDKTKHEYVTAIDFHDHCTYFPYSKNTGDVCLSRYISNFNDINFTKISGQTLFSMPGETIHGLRISRQDKAMVAVNHRTGTALDTTVTVIDLVKPTRNIAFYDSPIPVNTIDWMCDGSYYLAIGDDNALRIVDVRCPKGFKAVFFDKGVKKTALALQRPMEIACWDGDYVSLYDHRRPDVPCNIYDIGLNTNEYIFEMRFNPYITNELFVHTNQRRVIAFEVNPANCFNEWREPEPPFDQWQTITFKHIDRGCASARYSMERRKRMPVDEAEIPLLGYSEQYEVAKNDPEVPLPTHWRLPCAIDPSDLTKVEDMNEIDFESYLMKAVERVTAEQCYSIRSAKVLYVAVDAESYDFAYPGVNGIMCFSREEYNYKMWRSPKHYEGNLLRESGADSSYFYRGIQIQEMIPSQTFLMFIDRMEKGWNAYTTTEETLDDLASRITHNNRGLWAKWLANSAKIQYGKMEYARIGKNNLAWEQLTPLMEGPLPVVQLSPYETPKDQEAAEEVCQMLAPFFRMFLPNPQADNSLDEESDNEIRNAPPVNPYEQDENPHLEFPAELSKDMRTLCKCQAKMRYYTKKKHERKYLYTSIGSTFLVAASRRIREKFWRLGWKPLTKKAILAHRLTIDAKISRKSIVDDLSKFQRFKPREFQRRVLPQKMITDSRNILMKPEYIKEREEKEREMKAKSAKMALAPIGLSVAEKPGKNRLVCNSAAQELMEQAKHEQDPEKARFLVRAAMQLADNEPEKKLEQKKPSQQSQPYVGPASARPRELTQAMGTKGKDDFEYETAEDAYFGIKKKRMYVVFKPATAPLGLKRYKPDRLLESSFVRRLEHLVSWGTRKHEKKILYGEYEENDHRQSSIKERQTLDLKKALIAHKKMAWQTFYDRDFFYSEKLSYNQILRKAIQMYNIMCFDHYESPMSYVKHEHMVYGVTPKYVSKKCSLREAVELRKNFTMIETTIPNYNNFMNYLRMELPYQLDLTVYVPPLETRECSKTLQADIRKPTAEYQKSSEYMFPKGRLRFFEMEIPPDIMEEFEQQQNRVPPKKPKAVEFEDLSFYPTFGAPGYLSRKVLSCPDLCMDYLSTKNENYDDVIYSEAIRHIMLRDAFSQSPRYAGCVIDDFNFENLENDEKESEINSVQIPSFTKHLAHMNIPAYPKWRSPIIDDIDKVTKERFLRRVVPLKEPQPPRQFHGSDYYFNTIPLEVRRAAVGNTISTWMYRDPLILAFPGLQRVNAESNERYALCPNVPITFGRQKKKRLLLQNDLAHFSTHPPAIKNSQTGTIINFVTDSDNYQVWKHLTQYLEHRIRAPVFDEISCDIPIYLMEYMKPTFNGFFTDNSQSRYSIHQVAEMRNKRELQIEILTRRLFRFRQPLVEETEYELLMEKDREENINVEEDDLKTTSEESESENDDDEAREQRQERERRRVVKEVLEKLLEAVAETDVTVSRRKGTWKQVNKKGTSATAKGYNTTNKTGERKARSGIRRENRQESIEDSSGMSVDNWVQETSDEEFVENSVEYTLRRRGKWSMSETARKTMKESIIESVEGSAKQHRNKSVKESLKRLLRKSSRKSVEESMEGSGELEKDAMLKDFWQLFSNFHENVNDDIIEEDEDSFSSALVLGNDLETVSRLHEQESDYSSNDESSEEELPPRRKYGYAWPIYGHIPRYTVYLRFNPHTRANIRLMTAKEDEMFGVLKVLNEVYHSDLIDEKMAGGGPRPGSPVAVKRNKSSECHPIFGPIMDLVPEPLQPKWEPPVYHDPDETDEELSSMRITNADILRKLYKQHFSRRVQSSGSLQQFQKSEQFDDEFYGTELPRRASLEYFQPKDKALVCSACVEEPWPTKEMCIVCNPSTAVYRCSNIVNLEIPCNVCGANIYKFSCMNYEDHVKQLKQMSLRFENAVHKPRILDRKLLKYLSALVKREDNVTTHWDYKSYKPGDSTLNHLLETSNDEEFRSKQYLQLSNLIRRDFDLVCWQMDDAKAEKVFVSEEFSVVFDRDADVDSMRDTMNTISQDGEMDMMTTYDQRTGMRVRRWISYSALNTRIQKQAEKAKRRKKLAERETRILTGEITVQPSLLTELQQKVKNKEDAVHKAQEDDDQKKTEERRNEYKLWKKLPIPEVIEDPKKEMPNFPPPKQEDWLESSGSEDELPPIRSRIQSPEIKEFIATIRQHIACKPEKSNGLRVTYGKLFEKRPILKNDIVLVTKKTLKKKPTSNPIQRLPLDETWLNDSLQVSFLPVSSQIGHPRDAKKWMVPFYSSEKLQLSKAETKRRAFRPPTPPPSLANAYNKMKRSEQAHYHRQHLEKLEAMKKAHMIRQMRFRGKLVRLGKKAFDQLDKNGKRPRPTWKMACREMHLRRTLRLDFDSKLPRKRKQSQYVFSYFPKQKPGKPRKLSRREQSTVFSSSDSDSCPIVEIPKRRLVSHIYTHRKPVELNDKRRTVSKNATRNADVRIKKQAVSGQCGRKFVDPKKKGRPVSQIPVKKIIKAVISKKKRYAILCNPRSLLDYFSRTVPIVSQSGPKLRNRRPRSTLSKTTTNSQSVRPTATARLVNDGVLLPETLKKMDEVAPPATVSVPLRRSKSEPRRAKKIDKKSLVLIRSLSLDCGLGKRAIRKHLRSMERSMKKRLPQIAQLDVKKKRARFSEKDNTSEVLEIVMEPSKKPTLQKRSQMQTKTKQSVNPLKTNALESGNSEKVSRSSNQQKGSAQPKTSEVLPETPKLTTAPMLSNMSEVQHASMSSTRFQQKTEQLLIKTLNRQNFLEMRMRKIVPRRQISKVRGVCQERILLPQCLPSSYESDVSNNPTSSQRVQYIRNIRFTRKQKCLHRAPKRSRVLNMIRRIRAKKERNYALKCQPAIEPKIADLLFNPWIPLQRRRQRRVLMQPKPQVLHENEDNNTKDTGLNDSGQNSTLITATVPLQKTETTTEMMQHGLEEIRMTTLSEDASRSQDWSNVGNQVAKRFEKSYQVKKERKSDKHHPLSRNLMRRKLNAHNVTAKRFRVKCSPTSEGVAMSSPVIDVICDPSPNLKSCFKRGPRRAPNHGSAKKDANIGFGGRLRFLRSANDVAPTTKTPEPRESQTESLLDYKVGTDAKTDALIAAFGGKPRLPDRSKERDNYQIDGEILTSASQVFPLAAAREMLAKSDQQLRILKPVELSTPLEVTTDSTENRYDKALKTSEPSPPPKLPADQQWRSTMMARRNFGFSRPLFSPPEPSTRKEQSKEKSLKTSRDKEEWPTRLLKIMENETEQDIPEQMDALPEKSTHVLAEKLSKDASNELIEKQSSIRCAKLPRRMTEEHGQEATEGVTTMTSKQQIAEKTGEMPREKAEEALREMLQDLLGDMPRNPPREMPEELKKMLKKSPAAVSKMPEVKKVPTSSILPPSEIFEPLPSSSSKPNEAVLTFPTIKKMPIRTESKKNYVAPVAVPKPTAPPPSMNRTTEVPIVFTAEKRSTGAGGTRALQKSSGNVQTTRLPAKPSKPPTPVVSPVVSRAETTAPPVEPQKKKSLLEKIRSSKTPFGALLTSVIGTPNTSNTSMEPRQPSTSNASVATTMKKREVSPQLSETLNSSSSPMASSSPKPLLSSKTFPLPKTSRVPSMPKESVSPQSTQILSESNNDAPLLPRVKRPETGQLVKKLPPFTQKPPIAIGPIVKFVGGKPITNSPNYRKPMSQRAPPPPPPPPLSSSSSDEEEYNPFMSRSGDIPTTSSPEFFEDYQGDPPPAFISEKQKKTEEERRIAAKLNSNEDSGKATLSLKTDACLGSDNAKQQSAAGKSVTFGPTHAIDQSAPHVSLPPPAPLPKTLPQPPQKIGEQTHTFHMDLPTSSQNETLEQQRRRRPEEAAIRGKSSTTFAEPVLISTSSAPQTATAQTPKPVSKSFFFGLQPFGKMTPKSEKQRAQPATPLVPPPTSLPISPTIDSARTRQPGPSSGLPRSSTNQIPPRKASTRRQLKIGDPSPLQLSGDASLPKPAQMSPEKPIHLESPKPVKNYKSVSQRKHYTRLGQEWNPPKTREQNGDSEEDASNDASGNVLPVFKRKLEKKTQRKRKRKTLLPTEPTLVLDGTNHFKKLTAENLELLDREFDIEYKATTLSEKASDGGYENVSCMKPDKLKTAYRDFKKSLNEINTGEEMFSAQVDFNSMIDDEVVKVKDARDKRNKYETAAMKVRRMARIRKQRIKDSMLLPTGKRSAAIIAARQVRKVRFFQMHKKRMMPVIQPHPEPKSILKPPQPTVKWRYRIDCEGNKRYMRTFGPSAWQKTIEEQTPQKSSTYTRKPRAKKSYLKCWADAMAAIGKHKLSLWSEKEESRFNVEKLLESKHETRPDDVLVIRPQFGNHVPTASLSSFSVSSTTSLSSLLEAISPLAADSPILRQEPVQSAASVSSPGPASASSSTADMACLRSAASGIKNDPTNHQDKPQPSKQFPLVYIGMTVGRSPSTSTSMVDAVGTVESMAVDGSQIIEYRGQEIAEQSSVKRKFDPFVRPLSALLKAFTSNSAEIGLEAHPRARPLERNRLSDLFRRQSPSMPEFPITRPQSSSPTRRRTNRPPVTSISQGSSAEDILALMKAQPNALQKMEEVTKNDVSSLQVPNKIPAARPMFPKKEKLKNSLYKQLSDLRKNLKNKRIDEINDRKCKPNSLLNCTMLRKLINFNMDEYMRLHRFPRPCLDFALLGKYEKDSLRIFGKSRSGSNRSVALIVRKLDKCQERLEKAKNYVKSRGSDGMLTDEELARKARKIIKSATDKKKRKIRVQYKFKKTCVKYRVEVIITKKPRKQLARTVKENDKSETNFLQTDTKQETRYIVRKMLPLDAKTLGSVHSSKETFVETEVQPNTIGLVEHNGFEDDEAEDDAPVNATDYDGDDDGELENEEGSDGHFWSNSERPTFSLDNQRNKFVRHYFRFAVRMARKVARRSVGNKNPILFYSFISQMRTRMRQFMELRQQDVQHSRIKNMRRSHLEAPREKLKSTRERAHKKWMTRCLSIKKPPMVRTSLKYGGTVRKEVIINHSKFIMLKKHARVDAFFECMDEYIDVGTPIKLIFKSSNNLLPSKVFDAKAKQVDTDYQTSPSLLNTDSDYSTDAPENSRVMTDRTFFEKNSLESTYRMKGLPGLIYLAHLVEERIGDDAEQNIPFSGPALEYSNNVVFMSPIRRLMLLSMGLTMPDRIDYIKFRPQTEENYELWFERLFRMMCYGRGDFCKLIIGRLCKSQAPPRLSYEKMDIHYQAFITKKLFKKMIYLNDGREASMIIDGLREGRAIAENETPPAEPSQPDQNDRLIVENQPWTRENWIEACDMFLHFAKAKDNVDVSCRASIILLRMAFCGGSTQDIVDEIVGLRLSIRLKLTFIINLTPPESLVENIMKIFNFVRGLDRLPFVGLGYHADSMQVLYDEAVESGDPQLIAHLIRVGRVLDRRSGETMMIDAGSKHINNRDHSRIISDILTKGREKLPCGAPTLDEVFPYRYVRNADGSQITRSTEELAEIMEAEVTRYMAILELTKGCAVSKGDLDHNDKFFKLPTRFHHEVICTGCKMNVSLARNLGQLGRVICVSTMPMIEQDKDKKRWPSTRRLTPRLTYENYIEQLDPTENKMLMSKDIEDEKTDITVQVLPSRFGCYHCRFQLPRCVVCMCSLFNDHMDFALKDQNESFSQFAICNICNHGGHVNHIASWFAREKSCAVAGCECKCQPLRRIRNLKKRINHQMLLSVNMRAKSHLCNPECAVEADIDEGFLPDPDIELFNRN